MASLYKHLATRTKLCAMWATSRLGCFTLFPDIAITIRDSLDPRAGMHVATNESTKSVMGLESQSSISWRVFYRLSCVSEVTVSNIPNDGKGKKFFSSQKPSDRLWCPLNILFRGYSGLGMMLTIYLHLGPRLKMIGAVRISNLHTCLHDVARDNV